eukprot:403344811
MFYKDFDVQREFFIQRKKEIEELIMLLQERVDAERFYSQRLQKIGLSKLRAITLGKLQDEVEAYKQDCKSKGNQAEELAENMQQDCINVLKELLDKQEEQFFNQKMEGRILIQNLHDIDSQVKQRAIAYFRAAKEAEEAVIYYEENAKFSIDMKYHQKQAAYDNMIVNLKKAKEKESQYKEIIDNANSYLIEFRTQIQQLCNQMKAFENERCEAIHSAINKFVVYEMSAEMNNKYDVGNFSKLLEEYNNENEMQTIQTSLFPSESDQDMFLTSPQNAAEEEQKENLKDSPTKKKYNLKMKFQFAPYESKKIDIFKIPTQQLTPPREKISQYQNNPQDLIKFIINKIFVEQSLHEEYYVALNKTLQTQEGRSNFLNIIERRFNINSKVLIGKSSFQNIKDAVDMFLHEANNQNDLENAITLINYLDVFNLKNGSISSQSQQSVINKENHMSTGSSKSSLIGQINQAGLLHQNSASLKMSARDHIIWKGDKVWRQMIVQGFEFINLKSGRSNMSEEANIQTTDDGSESDIDEVSIKMLKFQVLEKVIIEMINFQVPPSVVKNISSDYDEDLKQNENKYESLTELISNYIQKRQLEAQQQMEQKRKPQAQKGVPDWLQDLVDPFENIMSKHLPTPQNNTQRDSVARNLAMTFKDLIKPKQSFGITSSQQSTSRKTSQDTDQSEQR